MLPKQLSNALGVELFHARLAEQHGHHEPGTCLLDTQARLCVDFVARLQARVDVLGLVVIEFGRHAVGKVERERTLSANEELTDHIVLRDGWEYGCLGRLMASQIRVALGKTRIQPLSVGGFGLVVVDEPARDAIALNSRFTECTLHDESHAVVAMKAQREFERAIGLQQFGFESLVLPRDDLDRTRFGFDHQALLLIGFGRKLELGLDHDTRRGWTGRGLLFRVLLGFPLLELESPVGNALADVQHTRGIHHPVWNRKHRTKSIIRTRIHL